MDDQHEYNVVATWAHGRKGTVSSPDIATTIQFSTPPEFKGDPGYWTPEHFLVAALASCYVATFFALADFAKLEFIGLQLTAAGRLGKPDGSLQFTEIALRPILEIASETDREFANRLLAKAHKGCLIARSLACPVLLEPFVQTAHEVFAR